MTQWQNKDYIKGEKVNKNVSHAQLVFKTDIITMEQHIQIISCT